MGMNGMVKKEHSFLHFPSKPRIFVPQNWEEWVEMDLGLMKILLKLLKYPFNLSPSYTSQQLFFSTNRKYVYIYI